MRPLLQVSLCCLLAGGVALAQRGGGHGGGGFGGARVGGGRVGGGVVGGVGGIRGGGFVGGGFVGGGFVGRPGFFFGRGFRRGWGFPLGFGGGFFGAGLYSPYLYDPSFGYPPYDAYPGGYYGANPYDNGYAEYSPSPNVTVIYPPQAPAPLAERARPVMREYDQYVQEVRPNASPTYLIAFTDHTIREATAYRVDGNTLHYTTPQNEQKDAPLNTVDRALSLQLNRERRVPFDLPPQ